MDHGGKRFGHDGADEGFQSSLTAFIDGGAGIAILTNSDNGGRFAHELILTIAREYGWSGFPQTEKTVVRLSGADLAESRDSFFLRDDGTPIEVVSHDGVTALTLGGALHAVKVQ